MQLHGTGEWSYPALIKIAREEGPGALYKGFAPKVLRLAPGGGVLLLVVEALSTGESWSGRGLDWAASPSIGGTGGRGLRRGIGSWMERNEEECQTGSTRKYTEKHC